MWSGFLTPTIGATGLLALAVLLVFMGFLVPRRTVDQMRRDKDAAITMWKDAYETSQRASVKKDQQIERLLEANRTTSRVSTALSEAAGIGSEGSRHALAPPEE
jgi:hypothetical protein